MNLSSHPLADSAKRIVWAVQDFTLLTVQAISNLWKKPRYIADTLVQMDIIGVGSLPVVLLMGFFTGAVLALQTYKMLLKYGQINMTGNLVALSLVKELGPTLTSLMVAGRNSSGMASELGSMQVTEQIDAMRALGTDPIKKLVTPRVVATVAMLPLLTVLADFVGLCGGFLVANFIIRLNPVEYWTNAYKALGWPDIFQGLLKPFVFAFILALVGCYYGLRTTGGTQGVGRSTTQAMVTASVLIITVNFFLTRLLLMLLP